MTHCDRLLIEVFISITNTIFLLHSCLDMYEADFLKGQYRLIIIYR